MKPSMFQLAGKPCLTKSVFLLNRDFNFSGEIALEIDSDIKIIETPDTEMCSTVTLNLKFFDHIDRKEVPFQLEMEIEGKFIWDKELEEDLPQLAVLLKENAPAILYSYLRPIITTLSIEANLPPLVIPLMNFREQPKASQGS